MCKLMSRLSVPTRLQAAYTEICTDTRAPHPGLPTHLAKGRQAWRHTRESPTLHGSRIWYVFLEGRESKREMTENELSRFEWKGIWRLSFTIKPCSGAAECTGPQRRPASKGSRAPDRHYHPLDTRTEVETIPTGHSVTLTVACHQATGQRHTQLSMGHGMGEEDTGTKSGTPGSSQ